MKPTSKATRKMPPPRNPFVAAAKFKKAGQHRKSNKAMRRAERAGVAAQWDPSGRLDPFSPGSLSKRARPAPPQSASASETDACEFILV